MQFKYSLSRPRELEQLEEISIPVTESYRLQYQRTPMSIMHYEGRIIVSLHLPPMDFNYHKILYPKSILVVFVSGEKPIGPCMLLEPRQCQSGVELYDVYDSSREPIKIEM